MSARGGAGSEFAVDIAFVVEYAIERIFAEIHPWSAQIVVEGVLHTEESRLFVERSIGVGQAWIFQFAEATRQLDDGGLHGKKSDRAGLFVIIGVDRRDADSKKRMFASSSCR